MNVEWHSPSRASPLPALGMSATGLSASRMAVGPPVRTEELRPGQSSPFGSPRLSSPRSGSSEDIWRVRKRVLGSPLTPIEETLRQRRGLQASMSTPSLTPGKEEFWGAFATGHSPLSQATAARTFLHGATSRNSRISRSAASSRSLPKGRWQHPLPADVVVRIKDQGWTTKGPLAAPSVWIQQASQARRLGRSNADRWLHDRLRLLAFLEQENVPQGLGAFRAAVSWRCGTLDRGFEQLSACGRGGRCPLSLLELAGSLALFGLDAQSLCGFNELEALRRLDADGDKCLGFLDLLNGGSVCAKSSSAPAIVVDVHADVHQRLGKEAASADDAPSAEVLAVAAKWILIVKFVALSAWFSLPLTSRARRRGDKTNDIEEEVGRALSPPPSSSVISGAAAIMFAATERDGGFSVRAGEGGRLARQQVLDPVRQQWAPSKGDFEVIQEAFKKEFNAYATSQNSGEPVISRVDFFRFLGDMPLPPVITGGDREEIPVPKLTQPEAGCLFDEVVDIQASTKAGSQSKGLHFDFFRLVLYKVSIALGLHFRYLVDDALEAGATVAS